MQWMTTDEVKKAAAGTLLDALECSREHHRQGATCMYEEGIRASDSGDLSLLTGMCALCGRGNKNANANCPECPLGRCNEGSLYDIASEALCGFSLDYSRANFAAFQEAERAMVAKLDELIVAEKASVAKKLAEEAKPKLMHGDYGFTTRKDRFCNIDIHSFVVIGEEIRFNTGSFNPVSEYPEGPYYIYTKLGNIFDDIKAMQEDVTEFNMTDEFGLGLKMWYGGGERKFRIEINGKSRLFLRETDMLAIAKACRQMEATLKRRQK